MAACLKDFPIPFEFIKKKDISIDFTFEPGKYQYTYRYQSSLDLWDLDSGEGFRL
jgi:hypothetical protein